MAIVKYYHYARYKVLRFSATMTMRHYPISDGWTRKLSTRFETHERCKYYVYAVRRQTWA